MTNETKFRVWWVPQVPMKSFVVDVGSVEEGRRLCSILADYDAFQFENKIKPDYCNVGGVSFYHHGLTGTVPSGDDGWWDVPDDEYEWNALLAEIAALNAHSGEA